MKREIKQEKIFMEKAELEAIIKKYEACKLCNKITKVSEIIGFIIGAFGVLSKSWILSGVGLGTAGISLAIRAISNKAQEKSEKQIEMLCGKTIRFIPKENTITETKEENYENEK